MSKNSNEITLGGLFLEFFEVAGETITDYCKAKNEDERAKIRQEISDTAEDIFNTIEEEAKEASAYIEKRLNELEEENEDFAEYFKSYIKEKYVGENDTTSEKFLAPLLTQNLTTNQETNNKSVEFIHKQPKPGDHIRVKRLGGLYYHHGIYIGNDTVIHFAPPDGSEIINWSEATVRKDALDDFLRGGQIEVRQYTDDELIELYSPREIIKNAQKCLGFQNYNLIFNNCEHFAYSCTTGTKRSPQVKEFFSTIVEIIS